MWPLIILAWVLAVAAVVMAHRARRLADMRLAKCSTALACAGFSAAVLNLVLR